MSTPQPKPLHALRVGTRFKVESLGITGRLLMVNDCRARVYVEGPLKEVNLSTGKKFHARTGYRTDWTPALEVVVLSEPEEMLAPPLLRKLLAALDRLP